MSYPAPQLIPSHAAENDVELSAAHETDCMLPSRSQARPADKQQWTVSKCFTGLTCQNVLFCFMPASFFLVLTLVLGSRIQSLSSVAREEQTGSRNGSRNGPDEKSTSMQILNYVSTPDSNIAPTMALTSITTNTTSPATFAQLMGPPASMTASTQILHYVSTLERSIASTSVAPSSITTATSAVTSAQLAGPTVPMTASTHMSYYSSTLERDIHSASMVPASNTTATSQATSAQLVGPPASTTASARMSHYISTLKRGIASTSVMPVPTKFQATLAQFVGTSPSVRSKILKFDQTQNSHSNESNQHNSVSTLIVPPLTTYQTISAYAEASSTSTTTTTTASWKLKPGGYANMNRSRPIFLFCGEIRDTLGSALNAFIALLTFVRAFELRTNIPAQIQLPPTPMSELSRLYFSGPKAEVMPLADYFNMTLLQRYFNIESAIQRKTCDRSRAELKLEGGVVKHGRFGQEATRKCAALSMDRQTFLCVMDQFADVAHSVAQKGVALQSLPLVVWIGVQWNFGRFQFVQTLFKDECLYAYRATELMPIQESWKKWSWQPSHEILSEVQRCAFVFVRERMRSLHLGVIQFTGPNPRGGVHCALCAHFAIHLTKIGAQLGKLLRSFQLSCATINTFAMSLKDETTFLRQLTKGAKDAHYPFRATLIRKSDVAPAAYMGKMPSNIAMMQIASQSSLFVTERGTLWSDLIANHNLQLGKNVAIQFSMKPDDLQLQVLNNSDCLLVRGQCVEQGENPYP